ncbi:MAG: GtrA family protein [Clostridiales bacterium]|uniref:GtrA family protein n=1 Tax=Clostridium sp. N3C TaxID=1776758 RepID=UPI00092DF700|nr:GtrA family protein [Clostridium sp. N3C]NLZ48237.1 GtrA family protein [Clostridiales bacterium]SCN22259.1 GtrA-like protein [Clostridium sp. N3C]
MFKQLFKFGIVGVINTVINVIIYQILTNIGIDPNLSNTIGYVAGTVNSYFFNNYWVFTAKDKSKEVLSKFIVVNLLTLGLSNILLAFFINKLNISKTYAQFFVIPITMIFNYLLNKFWTFKKGGKSK